MVSPSINTSNELVVAVHRQSDGRSDTLSAGRRVVREHGSVVIGDSPFEAYR